MAPIDARLAAIGGALAALEAPLEPIPAATTEEEARSTWAALEGDTLARRALVRRMFPKGFTIAPAAARTDAARFDIDRLRPA